MAVVSRGREVLLYGGLANKEWAVQLGSYIEGQAESCQRTLHMMEFLHNNNRAHLLHDRGILLIIWNTTVHTSDMAKVDMIQGSGDATTPKAK